MLGACKNLVLENILGKNEKPLIALIGFYNKLRVYSRKNAR